MTSRMIGFVLIAALAAGSGGCVTRTEGGNAPSAGPSAPAVATSLVIEQFLRAVNASDLDTMSRLFGTRQGPIVELYDRRQVDDRMYTIASILRHQDYTIVGTEIVPGRRDEATQVNVRMTVRGHEVQVPYTLVWSEDEKWLIEQIGLDAITNRR